MSLISHHHHHRIFYIKVISNDDNQNHITIDDVWPSLPSPPFYQHQYIITTTHISISTTISILSAHIYHHHYYHYENHYSIIISIIIIILSSPTNISLWPPPILLPLQPPLQHHFKDYCHNQPHQSGCFLGTKYKEWSLSCTVWSYRKSCTILCYQLASFSDNLSIIAGS